MGKVKLGDIAVLINGDRGKNYPSQKEIITSGGIPFVNAGHLNGRAIEFEAMNYITPEKYEKLNSGKFQQNDILYCLRGSLGKKALINDNIYGAIASSLVIIRPNLEKVRPQYLMLALETPLIKEQLFKFNNGSSQPNLSAKSVKEYKLELPDLFIQDSIISKLEKVRNLIEDEKQEKLLLDNLIQARFVEMFGDVVLNTKNWENYTWDNVLTIKNGKNQKDVENPKGIYPICGSGGIMNYADDYITESNSVIIGRKGNINNPILMREKFWNVDTAFGLEPNTTVLNVDYLFMFCNFFDFKILNKAVTIPSLTKADLLKIIIPIPPIELQERFADFVAQVDKSKVVVKKALDEAQILFDSLMQEYFG